MWVIELIKYFVKEKWFEAIDKSLQKNRFGLKVTCDLCLTVKIQKREGYPDPDCNSCICLFYARTRPWWQNNFLVFEPGMGEYCGTIIIECSEKDIMATKLYDPSNVHPHLKFIKKWLETNY